MRFDALSVWGDKGGLFVVLFLALTVRLLFMSGPLGGDDLTYIASATRILSGDWHASDYIGATRYGVNLPIAGFIWFFGTGEYSVIAWALVTSLIEVLIATYFGAVLFGKRAGLFAGLLLAFLPLHVHLAGRAMADTPLAMFITLSFYLFYRAERTGKAWLYWAAGLAAGAVFWIKESVFTFTLVFLLFPIVQRRWDMRWLYTAAGTVIMMLVNFLLFGILTGDFLHLIRVVEIAADRTTGIDAVLERSVLFYPYYLFADMRHTLFLGYLAVFGAIALARAKWRDRNPTTISAGNFVLIWAGGLVLLYTFFVMSFTPFQFVIKQTNYMLIFAGPLCLLGGYFISGLGRLSAALILFVYCAGGVLLSGMEQQTIQNFTSNSKATLAFANSRPEAVVFAGRNALNLNAYYSIVDPDRATPEDRLRPMADAQCKDDAGVASRFIVIDNETRNWGGSNQAITDAQNRLAPCWREVQALTPAGFSIGRNFMVASGWVAAQIPGQTGARLSAYISRYVNPEPAIVYEFGNNG